MNVQGVPSSSGAGPQQQPGPMLPNPQAQAAPAPTMQQQQQQQQAQYQQQQQPQQRMMQQPQQQQQQQQHIPHQGLNGGWQSDKDVNERRKMIAKIVQLLQQRKPNAPQEWLKKLPQMAKRLEESLYRSAPSFEAYRDVNTLKQRLQQLAMNIGMKTKNAAAARAQQQQAAAAQQAQQQAQGQGGQPQQQQQQQQQQQYQQQQALRQQPQVTSGANGIKMQPLPQQQQPQPPQQQPQQQQQHVPVQQMSSQPQQLQPQQQQQQQQQQPPHRQMVNMSDINPTMAAPAPPSQPGAMAVAQQPQPPAGGRQSSSQQPGMQQQPPVAPSGPAYAHQSSQQAAVGVGRQPMPPSVNQHPPASSVPVRSSSAGVAAPSPGSAGSSTDSRAKLSDRQQVLRHQQQRLLLLRHAAKCPHDDGRCPVTPHCAGMKRLWKHIAECKDQKCLVPHCVSSRYVLSHYHRCKDVRCPVCGPVREAIHRSHEKQKQMQAMKQRQAAQAQQAAQAGGAQVQSGGGQVPAQGGAAAAAQPTPSSMAAYSHPGAAPSQPGRAPSSAPQQQQPPQKRRKTEPGMPPNAVPSQQQQQQPHHRPLQHQPLAKPPGAPGATQPYVYNRPAGAGSAARPGVGPAPGVAYSNGQVFLPPRRQQPPQSGPKPQEDHTLINCFTIGQIETHIQSLNKGLQLSPQKLKAKCLEVLKALQSHQHGWVFNSPVDPVELGLPDYFQVIKRPMDLGTIKKRLENGCYHAIEAFQADVLLTFDNAMLYNPEGSVVYNMAEEMRIKFVSDYDDLIRQLNAEEDAKRKSGDACALCGCEKLLFEPPVFYCNGLNCPSKRIRRNSYYYVGGNNQYHWCHICYGELKENQPLELMDLTLKKSDLAKKKNDEVHEESWVQCDKCERWIHQICGLFNTRQNKDQRSEYTCPRCTIAERKKQGKTEGSSTTPMAEDLPRTKLSEFLEKHVRRKVEEYLEKEAKAKVESDNISLEEATKEVALGGAITIRQVTSMDRKLEVRERMKRRYAFKKYPSEFTFRCKCIVVFQKLDGVDTMLFGLYVYEHDEKNPLPNQRTVYVSYLDSVYYMRPRKMRTYVYHEILLAYLEYVRRKGFATAHIWACPPLKGDDYILYAKPEDQKTPRDDRLRQWYIDMLIEAQKRGVVGRLTNMYDLYFADHKNDATVVPYMDGDYFPAEVENIIKDLEEGKNSKKSSSGGKKKKGKAKTKAKGSRGGTRSTGLDEDALKASGMIQPGKDSKSLEEGGRDFVMAKLGETIHPMKESFIVAFLNWSGAKPENMVVPKEIAEYREKHGIDTPGGESKNASSEPTKEGEKSKDDGDKGDRSAPTSSEKKDGNDVKKEPGQSDQTKSAANGDKDKDKGEEEKKEGSDKVKVEDMDVDKANAEDKNATEQSSSDTGTAAAATQGSAEPSKSDKAAEGDTSKAPDSAEGTAAKPSAEAGTASDATKGEEKKNAANEAVRGGKFAAMAAKKRDAEGNEKTDTSSKEEGKEESKDAHTVKDSKGRTVKVLDDDLEELDCEFLNNRQAFLNLCQGNHYQFDQLRRAKHTSMMVLWHLHNRDAPKFVQQCAVCSREILTGFRYHCPTCADYDQCQECVSNPNTPRHPHQLKPIAVASGQQNELTEAQRKERQRSIQLHMTLLLHAATCNAPKCPSANCTKMKGLLKHGASCQVKATGGCHVCKRIWALLQIHARQCKQDNCPVPNCMAIRERFRQLTKQQQAMDDRRRQEMNRAYRGSR